MKKGYFISFSFILLGFSLFAQSSGVADGQKRLYSPEQEVLRVTASDIRLVPETERKSGGYHLYVRKRPDVESVLLTETTKDPEGKNDNYAYRALEYNEINGDEIRYLDGKQLVSEGAKYSLIDSTAEDDPVFGKAFHIYIPSKIQFGYDWSRNGVLEIGKGTFINIRTFEKKYADYSGNFMDSPFMFDLVKRPVKKVKKAEPKKTEPVIEQDPEPEPIEEIEAEPEPEVVVLTDDYNPVANEKFNEISNWMIISKGPETIIQDIMSCIDAIDGRGPTDVVFAIDATGSMKDDIDQLKKELVPAMAKKFLEFEDVRFGLLFYRDYGDNFKYKNLPVKFYDFTEDYSLFSKNLNSVVIKGLEGGDIPEAVYEALYASMDFMAWRNEKGCNRKIILIGDAEPHPRPRGTKKYTKALIEKKAEEMDIQIDAILLPSK